MVLYPEIDHISLSVKYLVHVRMKISTNQGNIPLLKRDVELEVVFQTDTSGSELSFTGFTSTLQVHTSRKDSTQDHSNVLATATAPMESHHSSSRESDFNLIATPSTVTPMVRLNAKSFDQCQSNDDPIKYSSTAGDDKSSKTNKVFFCTILSWRFSLFTLRAFFLSSANDWSMRLLRHSSPGLTILVILSLRSAQKLDPIMAMKQKIHILRQMVILIKKVMNMT